MRGWYDVPTTSTVSAAARPQAYGILQNPTHGDGSYRPEDLSTAYMLNGISQDLLDQAHFLEVPVVVPDQTMNGTTLEQFFSVLNETFHPLLPAPCTIANSWVTCDCGATYGTVTWSSVGSCLAQSSAFCHATRAVV